MIFHNHEFLKRRDLKNKQYFVNKWLNPLNKIDFLLIFFSYSNLKPWKNSCQGMLGVIHNGFANSLSKPCLGCHFTEQLKQRTPLVQCQRCNCTRVPSFTRHESTRKGRSRGSIPLAWPLPLTLKPADSHLFYICAYTPSG